MSVELISEPEEDVPSEIESSPGVAENGAPQADPESNEEGTAES